MHTRSSFARACGVSDEDTAPFLEDVQGLSDTLSLRRPQRRIAGVVSALFDICITSLYTKTPLGGMKINALHCIEIYGLTRLPEIMVILHGQPTLWRPPQCFG